MAIPPPVAARPGTAIIPPRSKLIVTAKYDFDATQADELTIRVGDKLEIIDKSDAGWWKGKSIATGKIGMIPSNYIS